MTKELRGYLSRVRKAQDAILNKENDCEVRVSLDVNASLGVDDDIPYIGVSGYRHEGIECLGCKTARIAHWLSVEEIEEELQEVSEYIGYKI